MTLCLMHLRDGTDEVLDPEGQEFPDMAAVRDAAIAAARDTMSHDVRSGRLELKYRIDVEDGGGSVVHSVPFAEAVEIVPA